MNLQTFLQTKAKAVTALVLGFLSPVLAFYQANQNLTLHQIVAGVVAGVVGGVAVHQIKNAPQK